MTSKQLLSERKSGYRKTRMGLKFVIMLLFQILMIIRAKKLNNNYEQSNNTKLKLVQLK